MQDLTSERRLCLKLKTETHSMFISYLSHCWDRISDKNSSRKSWFCFTVQRVATEVGTLFCVLSTFKNSTTKERNEHVDLACVLLFIKSSNLTVETFIVGLSSSVNET